MTSCWELLPTASGELVGVGAKAEGDTVVLGGWPLRPTTSGELVGVDEGEGKRGRPGRLVAV